MIELTKKNIKKASIAGLLSSITIGVLRLTVNIGWKIRGSNITSYVYFRTQS